MCHRFFQFQTAAADIFQCISVDLNRSILCKSASRLILPVIVDKYIAFHNHGLCLFPRWCQTTLYKKYIQSFFHNSSGNSANIFPSRNLHPVPVLFLIRQHFHVPQSSQELQS